MAKNTNTGIFVNSFSDQTRQFPIKKQIEKDSAGIHFEGKFLYADFRVNSMGIIPIRRRNSPCFDAIKNAYTLKLSSIVFFTNRLFWEMKPEIPGYAYL
jgi:hypothetical protein